MSMLCDLCDLCDPCVYSDAMSAWIVTKCVTGFALFVCLGLMLWIRQVFSLFRNTWMYFMSSFVILSLTSYDTPGVQQNDARYILSCTVHVLFLELEDTDSAFAPIPSSKCFWFVLVSQIVNLYYMYLVRVLMWFVVFILKQWRES